MVKMWTSYLLLVAMDVIQFSNCKLCKDSANATYPVDVNHTATAEFCVGADEKIDDVIKINKQPINLSDANTLRRYIVRVNETLAKSRCYTIHVINLTVGAVEKYTVNVTASNVSVCVYHFTVSFKNDSLRLCPGEEMNKTVTVYTNVTTMFHLCVTSDHGRVDHIGINRTVYFINGDANTGPYNVREVSVTPNHRNMQFLLIVIPSVSKEPYVSYQLMFSPASKLRIQPTVLIKHVSTAFPKPCDNRQDYRYFLAKVDEPKVLKFCFHHLGAMKSISLVKHHNDSQVLSEHRVDNSSINGQSQINVTVMGVQNSDFGRYELRLWFDEDFDWNVTFYLLEETDLPSEFCQHGTTAATTISDLNSTTSFCVQDYGVVFENDSVDINGAEHVVKYGQMNISSKLSVSGLWNRTIQVSYLQIHIRQLQIDDVKKPYKVTIPHLDKVFTFEIKLRVGLCKNQNNQLNITTILGRDENITVCLKGLVQENLNSIHESIEIQRNAKSKISYSFGDLSTVTLERNLTITISNVTNEDAGSLNFHLKDVQETVEISVLVTPTATVATVEMEQSSSGTSQATSFVMLDKKDLFGVIAALCGAGCFIIITIITGGVALRRRKRTKDPPPSPYPDSTQTYTSSERSSDTPSSSRHVYERISDIISSILRSSSSGSSRSWSSVVTDYRRKVVLSEVVYAEYSLPDGSSWDSFSQRVESDGSDGTLKDCWHRDGTLKDCSHRDGTLTDGTLRNVALNDGTLKDGRLSDRTLRDGTLRDCTLMNYST